VLDLNSQVENLRTMLERLISEDITLVTVLRPGLRSIIADPSQIEQVIMNLVVNARDAMPTGGTIDITIEPVTLDERASLRYSGIVAGEYVRVAVRDTGVGIDPELQPHVFEPFFTTKAPAKGTGLGLSIIYGIVKEAGGAVTFATAPNEGTTFEVLLPLRIAD